MAVYLLVNTVAVDGRTCLTFMSSVIPQGELLVAVKTFKKLLKETAAGAVRCAPTSPSR